MARIFRRLMGNFGSTAGTPSARVEYSPQVSESSELSKTLSEGSLDAQARVVYELIRAEELSVPIQTGRGPETTPSFPVAVEAKLRALEAQAAARVGPYDSFQTQISPFLLDGATVGVRFEFAVGHEDGTFDQGTTILNMEGQVLPVEPVQIEPLEGLTWSDSHDLHLNDESRTKSLTDFICADPERKQTFLHRMRTKVARGSPPDETEVRVLEELRHRMAQELEDGRKNSQGVAATVACHWMDCCEWLGIPNEEERRGTLKRAVESDIAYQSKAVESVACDLLPVKESRRLDNIDGAIYVATNYGAWVAQLRLKHGLALDAESLKQAKNLGDHLPRLNALRASTYDALSARDPVLFPRGVETAPLSITNPVLFLSRHRQGYLGEVRPEELVQAQGALIEQKLAGALEAAHSVAHHLNPFRAEEGKNALAAIDDAWTEARALEALAPGLEARLRQEYDSGLKDLDTHRTRIANLLTELERLSA